MSHMTAEQKINLITNSFKMLAKAEHKLGNNNVAKIADKAAEELPDSSKLKLYEILKD